MRTNTLLGTLLLATSLLPACATEAVVDELADETAADGEAGKADSAAAFTYYMVTPDPRACSLGSRCGGFFVARPNRSTTLCADGSTESLCYVDHIDWAGTAMPASVAAAYETRVRNEETFLFRGSVKAVTTEDGLERAALAATELWTAGSATGVVDGVFLLVTGGHACAEQAGHPPCTGTTIRESRLNSNLGAEIDEVDFSDSGADPTTIRRADEVLEAGSEAIIVVGDRYYTSGDGKGRTANQFFTRAPVPLHGNPGSCVPGASC